MTPLHLVSAADDATATPTVQPRCVLLGRTWHRVVTRADAHLALDCDIARALHRHETRRIVPAWRPATLAPKGGWMACPECRGTGGDCADAYALCRLCDGECMVPAPEQPCAACYPALAIVRGAT